MGHLRVDSVRCAWAAFVALSTLCWAGAGLADTIVPHSARYKIKISIASGVLETNVREDGNEYVVESVLKPTGLARLLTSGTIEEMSRFSVGNDGVRPNVFASKDTLSKVDTFMDFAFDWEAGEVRGTVNEDEYRFALDGDIHDRVSIQYQLMHNLVVAADSKDYGLMEGDELKKLTITTSEPRRLKVPFGTFEVIGVSTQAANSKRITTLWCAEELGYLPVLIEQHRKGKRIVRAALTHYEPLPDAATLSATAE
ncbi:MAG: DUF3108 domain-containing protein [Pseudomonadota bacterium]